MSEAGPDYLGNYSLKSALMLPQVVRSVATHPEQVTKPAQVTSQVGPPTHVSVIS
jgi:hypothetical protein